MFKEFEKQAKKRTPKVSLCRQPLEFEKGETNTQENLLAMLD